MRKINYLFISLALIFLILPLVSAQQQTLGTFKQNSCILLKQSCSNCTFNNVTSVFSPSGQTILGQSVMTQNGSEYYLTFCSTAVNGQYIVNGIGDLNGVLTTWNYNFFINSDGLLSSLGFYFLIVLIIGLILILGIYTEEQWIIILSGFFMIAFGLYCFINGIAGVSDKMLTVFISAVIEIVGFYISVRTALEMIGEY